MSLLNTSPLLPVPLHLPPSTSPPLLTGWLPLCVHRDSSRAAGRLRHQRGCVLRQRIDLQPAAPVARDKAAVRRHYPQHGLFPAAGGWMGGRADGRMGPTVGLQPQGLGE